MSRVIKTLDIKNIKLFKKTIDKQKIKCYNNYRVKEEREWLELWKNTIQIKLEK